MNGPIDEEIAKLAWKLTCLIKLAEEKEEMDIIKRVQDPEQQGYMAGPLMCKITGCTPEFLLASAEDKPFLQGDDAKRDAGMRRWCKEQLRHGLRAV